MANLTTNQKVTQTIQKFEALGVEISDDTKRKMTYVLARLIENQHTETRLKCYETINQQNGEEVSNLNPIAVAVGLRWAQHVIGQLEL